MYPLDNIHVTSPFGWRIHPVTKKRSFHAGVDLRARYVPVYCVAEGTVQKINHTGATHAYGKQIYVNHAGSIVSFYGHLSEINVAVGQKVKMGQQIGVSGNSGTLTTAPHLHFGMQIRGEWLNPMEVLLSLEDGSVKRATSTKYKIGGDMFEGMLIDGELWVKGRESHTACGNEVNWTAEKGAEIIPLPKITLDRIKQIL